MTSLKEEALISLVRLSLDLSCFSLSVSMVSLCKNPGRDVGQMMYTAGADLSIYYLNMIRI